MQLSKLAGSLERNHASQFRAAMPPHPQPLTIDDADIDDIVEFLKALTDVFASGMQARIGGRPAPARREPVRARRSETLIRA
jgi:hypothetical protein